MSEDIGECTPTVILLLSQPRQVTVVEVRRVVAAELGEEAAAMVEWIGENGAGMSYIGWRNGKTPYHLGTCSEPYITRVGTANAGEPVRWMMKEEVPPEAPRLCEAWMSHTAWLYVDALTAGSLGDGRSHLSNVLRVASWLVDEKCVLVWLYGGESKRVVLPSPETVLSFRNGLWPE